MMLHVALVAEILATVICIHCIYGRKVKLDVKTAVLILSILVILEIINFYHLGGIASFGVYIVLFIYCKGEFKSTFIETLISLVLCMIISTSIQFICISVISLLNIDEIYTRNAFNNILTLGIVMFFLPLCKLHKVRESLCKNSKFVVAISGFMCLIVVILLLQGKVLYEIEVQDFIFVIPAIFLLLYSVVKWYVAQTEAERIEKEFQETERDRKEYEDLLTKVRLRQHAFKNHITAIFSSHYTYNTYEKLVKAQEEYCNKLLSENKYNNLLLLGNNILAGYLYGKFQEAEMDGIAIHYKITAKVNQSYVPIYYVVEMLGIIFDNAVEAIKNALEKTINIEIYEQEDVYEFVIRNPFPYVSYDNIADWFQLGKSEKGNGRGLGLYHLKCLCEQWKCDIECRNMEIDQKNWIVFILRIGKTDNK